MRSAILVRHDAVVVDRIRVTQAIDAITHIVRCSAQELRPETLTRLIGAKSTLEDVFHELALAKNELAMKLVYMNDDGSLRPPRVPREFRGNGTG